MLENGGYSFAVGWNVLYMSVRSIRSKSCSSLLFLYWFSAWSIHYRPWVVKFPNIIALVLISPFVLSIFGLCIYAGYINIYNCYIFLVTWCRRQWHPSPVLSPGKSHGQRSLVGYSPWGGEESDTTERLHFHFSLSCIGEGNGNPLQCSCLENPRDGGAWWAAVYRVAQSWTRLKRLSSSSSSRGLTHIC